MRVHVAVTNYMDINLKPGDRVFLSQGEDVGKESTIYKMVETTYGVYAVFTNGTWRPVSTYNETWWKVQYD